MGSSGNEILDMYIYETNTLLEQLETIVLEAEKADTFSQDDVNEIFRIMHTIKGSSAMMEYDSLATVSHRIEDLFFIIRENTMSVVSVEHRPRLFDLMFQSIDYFRSEMEKVEAGQPLDKNIDTFLENVNSLISKIKGEAPSEAAASAPTPAPAASSSESSTFVKTGGNPDFPYELHVFFDEGCGMENLRAYMLVVSIQDFCAEADFLFEPAAVENDASTAEQVIKDGFLLMFKHAEDREKAIPVVRTGGFGALLPASRLPSCAGAGFPPRARVQFCPSAIAESICPTPRPRCRSRYRSRASEGEPDQRQSQQVGSAVCHCWRDRHYRVHGDCFPRPEGAAP